MVTETDENVGEAIKDTIYNELRAQIPEDKIESAIGQLSDVMSEMKQIYEERRY